MGVPGLALYYYLKYGTNKDLSISIDDIAKRGYDWIFFDYNSLIHPCAYQIISANEEIYNKITDINERTLMIENDIITNCIVYTKLIINQCNVSNVNISIDGIAPRSKMQQQRERRYKSEFFALKDKLWDSNKITPGTNFMEKLSRSLRNEFKNAQLSDSNEPGEGEHKIMNIIKNIPDKQC